jgi:hypothetical protein
MRHVCPWFAGRWSARREFRDRTEWTPDAPADRDLLGRERLAEALAKRMKGLAAPDSKTKQSFLVHVDGPWGAGKSTLFKFLEDQLKEDQPKEDQPEPTFLVVKVNAWREQRVGVQWWTLLSALRRAVIASRPWYARPFTRLVGLVDRIRAGWVPFVVALLVLGASLAALVSVAHFDLTAGGKAADSILKIVALASATFGGLVAAARFLLPGSRRSAQGFVETHDNPMQEVGRLFARTLRRARQPVVFLIDDLDRCDEGYVVEFLEVVQTLLRDAPSQFPGGSPDQHAPRWRPRRRAELAGPYAFIAADGRWIRSSYEKHYDAFVRTGAPGRPLGYLFLEKVFQLHVRLPSITDSARQAFLASLLGPTQRRVPDATSQEQAVAEAKTAVRDAKSEPEVIEAAQKASNIRDPVQRMGVLGDAAVKFSDREIQDAAEHALAQFSAFLEPNPRSMRVFVNTYGILRSLRTLEEVFVPVGPLGLWAIMEIRWPFLADHLRGNPDAVKDPNSDDLPEDVKLLLRREDVSEVLLDPHMGPLTPELIRQCSGS